MTRDDGVHRFVPPILRPLSIGIGRGVRSAHHSLRGAFSRVHPTPIFVLGNQKSGTSAIAALLARACGLSVSLDMLQETRRPIFQHVVRGELDFERYVRVNRWEFSHDVVKEPNLSLLYPQLAAYFAASPFVFVMRDPRDNLRSLLNGLAIPGDLETLEARHRHRVNAGWKLVLDGRWLGIEGTHYIEQLAGRWVHLARIYLAHADRMHLCRYEIFAADKLAELRRLAGLLSRPVVADVSGELERAFQPSGDRSVRWEAFFGERNLARIEAVCGETMLALGYSPSRLRG